MSIFGGSHKSRHLEWARALKGAAASILLFCSAAQAAEITPIATASNPETEVVVMLELDGEPMADSFVADESKGRLSVPVCALAEVLSLAVKCSDNRAYGFILSESQPFVVDLDEGYAISVRKAFPVSNSAFSRNGDIYVDISELSKWLPLDFQYLKGDSTLRLHAREIFPVQGFKKRQMFKQPDPPPLSKHYDDLTTPTAVATVPTIDFASQFDLSRNGHSSQSNLFNSADISGDLLHMSSETHFRMEGEEVKRLDFTLYKRSVEPMKMALVPMTQIALGATQAPYIDGIGASSMPMYGLFLSNRPLFGSSKFLTHDVNGYLPPGWDAELFHNGTQIGYQPPTTDGMYHFVNIRVYYGINDFKVVLHGPFGERRESEEVIVSDAVTPRGEFLYTLSAGWQTALTKRDTPGLQRESNQTITTDFGLSGNLTASGLFVRHTDFYGREEDYAGVSVRTALRYTLLSLELIQSFSPGDGRNGQLVTARSSSRNIAGLNLEVIQRFFHGYNSPQFPDTADPLVTKTTLKGNSSFTLLDNIRVPFAVELDLSTRKSGKVDATSASLISGGWNGWNCTLEADISYLEQRLYSASLIQISTRLSDISIRGQAGYSFAPKFTPATINLTADKDLGQGYQLNSGFLHDPVTSVSSLRLGFSKSVGRFGYSISASGSTDGVYQVGVGVRGSAAADLSGNQSIFSAQPLSPYGMISVSAVVLEAGNAAGKPLPAVGFLINGARATTIAGTRGGPVIVNLQPDIPVDVTVDMTTVEDPFMVAVQDGCHIIPRAGVVSACTFTLTTGGEIDGMVLAQLGSGEVPLKGVRVDLMTTGPKGMKLQATTTSQESGYYLFKTVRPGNYRVVIPDSEVARLKSTAVTPIDVTIPVGGDMVSGKDFVLSAQGGKHEGTAKSR